jgi:hypothetical protein
VSERGIQLRDRAERQISELIRLVSARDQAALSLPCPGREKLGDGTVAALAMHTADNYLRIAGFVLGRGHAPPDATAGGHGEGTHDSNYTAEAVDRDVLVKRLSAGRDALSRLADLTDDRLDSVPPAASFRFCDGQRTVEQVLARLLNHQGRQIDAL